MIELFTEGTDVDNVIHLITVLIALLLFAISLRSYLHHKGERFLYVCLAFLFFAIREVIVVFDVLFFQSPLLVFISHMFNLIILGLFFIGVVKK